MLLGQERDRERDGENEQGMLYVCSFVHGQFCVFSLYDSPTMAVGSVCLNTHLCHSPRCQYYSILYIEWTQRGLFKDYSKNMKSRSEHSLYKSPLVAMCKISIASIRHSALTTLPKINGSIQSPTHSSCTRTHPVANHTSLQF